MSVNKHIIKAVTEGFGKAKKDIKGVDSSLKGMAKAALAAGAALYGAKKLLDGMKAAIRLAGEQELAEKKLEAALGKRSKSLLQYAKELQQVSRYGDEVTLSAMTMIASFVKDEDAIKQATKATMDLAAAKGFDIVAAADLVSKTLGSSTNALTRYGIEVTGAVGSSERLESLTKNIARVFGGQATAQADTFTGQVEQMHNALGDMGEELGKHLIPLVTKFANNIKDIAEMVGAYVEVPMSEQLQQEAEDFSALISKLKIYGELGLDRAGIIETLNTKYKDYLPNLITEKTTLEELNRLQKTTLENIQKQAIEEAIAEKVTDLINEKIDMQMRYAEVLQSIELAEKKSADTADAWYKNTIFKHNMLLDAIYSESGQEMMLNAHKQILPVLLKNIELKQEEIDKLYENATVVEYLEKQERLRLEAEIEAKQLAIEKAKEEEKALEKKNKQAQFEKEQNIRVAGWWDDQINRAKKALEIQKMYNDNIKAEMEIRDAFKDLTSPAATLESELEAYMTFYENRNELVHISEQEHADIIKHYQDQISDRNKDEIKQRVSDTVAGLDEIGNQFKAFKKVAQAAAIAETIYSTYYAAQEAYTNWIESKLPIDPATKQALGVANAALAVGQGMARVQQIRKAAVGADYIADEPQLLMVGEQGLRERVQVTPLDGVNIEGGTQGITLNIQGNVLTDSFVEESIVPSLREALRQGEVLA